MGRVTPVAQRKKNIARNRSFFKSAREGRREEARRQIRRKRNRRINHGYRRHFSVKRKEMRGEGQGERGWEILTKGHGS